MSQDERPGEERGQEELIAAFAALGGPLTDAEFMRLLGSDEYCGVMVRLAALLLDGDTAAARAVVRDSLAAVQAARGRLGDREQARVYMCRAVVDRSRSVHWHRAAQSHHAPQAAPGVPGAAHAGIGYLDQEPPVSALRALPYRQREAVVLRHHMGLSERQTAQVMGISIGAARSHLARGMSLLERPPRQ
jgi:DNA-directed RNA polymerase specialized sigma24 family protein